MPRLWANTMDSHRRQVNDAILDAAAELMAQLGPLSVSMSAIAERAGIGRATLYKYFPDVESVLHAWHAREFAEHLEWLRTLVEAEDPTLDDITELVVAQRHNHPIAPGSDHIGAIAYFLASGEPGPGHTTHHEVAGLVARLLTRLADHGQIRADVAPDLLARWLLHVTHAPSQLDDQTIAQLLRGSLAPTQTARTRTSGRSARS